MSSEAANRLAPEPYVVVIVRVGSVTYPEPGSVMNTLAIEPFSELLSDPSSITIFH